MVEALIPFTQGTRTGKKEVDDTSLAMATAYGDSMIFDGSLDTTRGMGFVEAARFGIPAMLGEVGQQGICDEASIGMHLKGMNNLLKVLGMTEGAAPASASRVMAETAWVLATASGAFHPIVALGDHVGSGQKVGDVSDVFGEVLEEVFAPKSGTVFVLLTGLAVSAGENLIGIAVSVE